MEQELLLTKSILLIDDSQSSTSLLEAILQKEGFHTLFSTRTVTQAFDIMEENSIDLILLSYILPEVSGVEVCQMISDDMRFEDIPIIMVTANTDIQTLKKSFEHGASDYLAKPIKAIELVARVQSHLIRKHINDERKTGAITDALTTLYNRRYFDTIFDSEYTKALAEERSLSFFMMDIDNFKKYNDHYGHQAGDEVLKAVATALKESLHRMSDYLFRTGGEEFAIILLDSTPSFIHQLSHTIHASIQALGIEHRYNDTHGNISISIGVATMNDLSNFSKIDIYNRADEALYQAKQEGRNRTHFVQIN